MNASPSACRDGAPTDAVRDVLASKARATRASVVRGVGAALLLAGLAACGGGGTDTAAPAPTVPSPPVPSPPAAQPPPVATAPELPPPQDRWSLETGGNPADELERYAFEDVTLALNDFSLAPSRSTDQVQRDGDTLTVMRDGRPVLTVARDGLGITASVPDTPGARVGLALRGELNGTLTVFSQRPLRLTLAGATLASGNDALDSNGTLTIAGGVVVARSVAPMESGVDCDSGLFSLTGGTLLAIGHRNSVPTAVVTTQNVVLLRALAEGRWTLRDDTGAAPYAFTLPDAVRTVLLSSPRLATGSTLTLVGGGDLGPFPKTSVG
jgi:hypothetical protein